MLSVDKAVETLIKYVLNIAQRSVLNNIELIKIVYSSVGFCIVFAIFSLNVKKLNWTEFNYY
jgi:glycopeptide antibiotics resistance protein